ncbi:hypothetical protein BDP27DRAFT_1367030 [Rhodocollybia butyracea]|uniref:Uncharacterized protein n=1 Tax=Rhodocollybia butyracea TaxID=206335 RepID=A0A9P5U4F5_9AGAR|nr:hypothetical protein BDP27DRAFT_1367030 [Rhodocollybia butyracea]
MLPDKAVLLTEIGNTLKYTVIESAVVCIVFGLYIPVSVIALYILCCRQKDWGLADRITSLYVYGREWERVSGWPGNLNVCEVPNNFAVEAEAIFVPNIPASSW